MAPFLWALIIGTFIPLVTAAITKWHAPAHLRAILTAGLAASAGALTGALGSGQLDGQHWQYIVATAFAAWSAAVVADFGLWRSTGAAPALAWKTRSFGFSLGAALLTMYDSTDVNAMPSNGDIYAGYMDGRYQTFHLLAALFPGKVYIAITVFGAPGIRVCDCEFGDLTPAQAAAWAKQEIASGNRPTIYCNTSTKGQVDSQLAQFGLMFVRDVDWWEAHYDGIPVLTPGSIAKQYQSTTDLDTSVVDPSWVGQPVPPPPPPITELQEDFMEGRYLWTPKKGPYQGVEQDVRVGFDPRVPDPGNNLYVKHGARDSMLQEFKNQQPDGSFICPQTPLMFETKDGGQLKISLLERPAGNVRDLVIDGTVDANGAFIVNEADAP